MAAGTVTLFSKNKNLFKESDLTGFTVKLLLTTSTFVPDTSVTGNSVLADVTNELANGNGYTTGGVSLASLAVTAITSGYKFSSAAASWTASGTGIPAWRNAVMYISGAQWGLTSPLLGFFLGDSTPADIALTASGNVLNLNCPANGWFDLT
jgi:hypothetical protein